MINKSETRTNYLVLILFTLAVLFPLLVLLSTALSPVASGTLVINEMRFSNFADAWVRGRIGHHLTISALISVVTVLVTLVITPLAAFAIGILKVPGHRILFPLFLVGILIPLEGLIVPLYFTLRSYGLTGSPVGLLLAHIGLAVSFGVFWMRASFQAVPPSLIEAARIDGASNIRLLCGVVLPITKPALITLALLTFMWTWNDFFLAFVLVNSPDQLPVTVALGAFSGRYTTEFNLLAAAAIIVALPVVLIYIFFQRYFIQGVLTGALKG